MPHTSDYNCTPPKGGGSGRIALVVVALVLFFSALGAIERAVSTLLIDVAIGMGSVLAGSVVIAVTVRAVRHQRIQRRDRKVQFIMNRNYGPQPHPLDGGPRIHRAIAPPRRLPNGDILYPYPEELLDPFPREGD